MHPTDLGMVAFERAGTADSETPPKVKIAHFRPEKIEFKDKRVKFKMCVLVILT